MSSNVGIRARGLGKRYHLCDSAAETLANAVFEGKSGIPRWALRGFDLDARPGDFIGVIGRNGAGKSTLLQLIAGATEPSEGSLDVQGRVAALLELGAGFNPDFTGYENARLCSAIYGLTPAQIDERMGSIVAFAGIEPFMERPVREYSSGMFARLAFSVCAHVDADILIVDEILGVGDVDFQQRSMRFLRSFAKGKIVLFVTHNEAAVLSLCNRAIWLSEGEVVTSGRPREIVYAYHKAMASSLGSGPFFESHAETMIADQDEKATGNVSDGNVAEFVFDARPAGGFPEPGAIQRATLTMHGAPVTTLEGGETVSIAVHFQSAVPGVSVAIAVRNEFGEIVFYRDGRGDEPAGAVRREPQNGAVFSFRLPFVRTAQYAVDVALVDFTQSTPNIVDRIDAAIAFEVVSRHISDGMANVPLELAEIRVDPS